jgi:hypothetical protein
VQAYAGLTESGGAEAAADMTMDQNGYTELLAAIERARAVQ